MRPWSAAARKRVAARIVTLFFANQLAAAADKNRRKCLWTTRRAGKTFTIIADMMVKALYAPHSMSVFVSLTFDAAESIAWPILKKICRIVGLEEGRDVRFQEQKLRITLPGGGTIQLYGANRLAAIYKLYGRAILSAAVDEAAFMPAVCSDLVDDVLYPGTLDHDNGTMWIASIPGKISMGLHYELTHQFNYEDIFSGRRPHATLNAPEAELWSVHTWTTAQNPHMSRQFAAEIDEKKRVNKSYMKDPNTLRNYFKAWVQELGEKVYRFEPYGINKYPHVWSPHPADNYVLGVDTGWNDAKALSLNGWRENNPHLVEVWSWKKSFLLLKDFAAEIREVQAAYPVDDSEGGRFQIVGDASNREVFEELRRAHNIPMMEAERWDKRAWIDIFNSEAASGNILVQKPEKSPSVHETLKLVKKFRPDGTWIEQPGMPNDCCDARLVAFRHARHYLRGEVEPDTVLTQRELHAIETKKLKQEYLDSQEQGQEAWNEF